MALSAVGLKTHILNNHLKSVLLLAGFPLLLLCMMGAFFVSMDALAQAPSPQIDWHKAFATGVEGVYRYGIWAVTAALAWFAAAYFLHARMIRRAAGSRPVTRAEYPEIYNLLENLCISRGLTMPRFEIIDTPALNAFASGIDENSYRIVLTRGLIDKLNRDELEAVIAHELTHIVNRDVRLLIVAVVFVGIISFAAEMVFRLLTRGARLPRVGSRREGAAHVLVLLVALAILAVGYVLAIVIRFALSRKREYLADAGAVELTKNPEAMMRALLKISGRDRVQGMPDEVQQMCIENSHHFMGLFSTHPAIEDRVRAISAMTGTPVPVLAAPAASGPWG